MSLPPFMTRNLGWKALSVMLATLVWMTLYSGVQNRLQTASPLTFRQRPVTVLTTPMDGHAFQVSPATVDVTVSGSPDLVERLRATEVLPFVDLTAVANPRDLPRRVQVLTPPGINVKEVRPPDVVVIVSSGPADPANTKRKTP